METTSVLSGFAIVILDRGFVYIGDATVDDEWCVITNVRNIRKYGTTDGLGELSLNGPTDNTVLDRCNTVRAPIRSVIHVMDADADQWK